MSAYKSEFLQVLAQRGFIHQISDAAGRVPMHRNRAYPVVWGHALGQKGDSGTGRKQKAQG